jgi:hypothetical protein
MSVAFVREESAEAAQEVSLPLRAISAHPNLVTQSGLRALECALANSQQALKAAQTIEDSNERRRALELAARDARYFAERVASAVPQPEPADTAVVVFGSQVTVLRDDDRVAIGLLNHIGIAHKKLVKRCHDLAALYRRRAHLGNGLWPSD